MQKHLLRNSSILFFFGAMTIGLTPTRKNLRVKNPTVPTRQNWPNLSRALLSKPLFPTALKCPELSSQAQYLGFGEAKSD